ncbi:MAG: DUF1127 domain-containing protein [Pseudomonadota bacterium]
MSAQTFSGYPAALAKLGHWLTEARADAKRRAEIKAATARLALMSDRELEDVGVTREQLAALGFETKTAAPTAMDAADQFAIRRLLR